MVSTICYREQHAREQSYRERCASGTERGMIAVGDVVPNRGVECSNVCHHTVLSRTCCLRDPDDGDGCRGGFRTRPYGRCLCRSPYHPRDAVNEGHHTITPGVITDPANVISAAPAGVDTGFRRCYPWRNVWRAAATLPQQAYTRSGAWPTVPHAGHGDTGCARSSIEAVRHACDPCV